MNKKIIALIIVIIIAIIGSFTYAQLNNQPVYTNGKINTVIEFQSSFSVDNNDTDSTTFILKDKEGNTLADKNVSITYKVDGKDKTFYATTDKSGKVIYPLVDMDKDGGNVVVKFDGDDKYNPSSDSQYHVGVGN